MANGGCSHKQLRYDGLMDPTEFLNAFGLQSLMYKWTEDQQVEAIGFMLTGMHRCTGIKCGCTDYKFCKFNRLGYEHDYS
jgi:hypothetical protein